MSFGAEPGFCGTVHKKMTSILIFLEMFNDSFLTPALFLLCFFSLFFLDLLLPHPPRAQEIFRQAMHSPVVRLEVVPSSNRESYEKSLIGQLFSNSSGPDSSPRIAKTKELPPPVKAKPVFKPNENPATRLSEDSATLEAAVRICLSILRYLDFRHLDIVEPPENLFTYVKC